MPSKRKNNSRTLPSRKCKKPRLVTNLRKHKDIINYDESSYDLLDYLDESEVIEISSDDRSEVAIVNCVNPDRFTDTAKKDEDLLSEVANNLEKSVEPIRSRSDASAFASSRSTISISESDTMSSIRSTRQRTKILKKRDSRQVIEEMYIVEKILAMREVEGIRQFYLKWEGFPETSNSWEPEENIDSKDIIMEYLAELERKESIENIDQKLPAITTENESKSAVIEENKLCALDDNIKQCSSTKDSASVAEAGEHVEESNVQELTKPNCVNEIKDSKKRLSKRKSKRKSAKHIKLDCSKDSEIDLTADDEHINVKIQKELLNEVETINHMNEVSEDIKETIEKPDVADMVVIETKFDEMAVDEVDLTMEDEDSKESEKEEPSENVADNGHEVSATEEKMNNSISSLSKEEFTENIAEMDKKSECSNNDDCAEEEAEDSDEEHDVHSQGSDDAFNVHSKHNSKTNLSNLNTYFPENLPQDVQEIFQVEKILRMRYSSGKRFFYLKWEGFPNSENSWEPEENLECPELIEDFLSEQKRLRTTTTVTVAVTSKKSEVKMRQGRKAPVLETLPDNVRIKEPAVKPRGFPKEREAEMILGSGLVDGELNFLIKWKNVDMANLVPATRANIECPQVVIRFYEGNLTWHNIDGSITTEPKEKISSMPPVQIQSDEHYEHQHQIGRPRINNKKKQHQQTQPMHARKQSIPSCRPIFSKAPPGALQAKKLTTGASRMLNIINSFQARKQDMLASTGVPTAAAVARAPSVVQSAVEPLVAPLCQYESRDLPVEPVAQLEDLALPSHPQVAPGQLQAVLVASGYQGGLRGCQGTVQGSLGLQGSQGSVQGSLGLQGSQGVVQGSMGLQGTVQGSLTLIQANQGIPGIQTINNPNNCLQAFSNLTSAIQGLQGNQGLIQAAPGNQGLIHATKGKPKNLAPQTQANQNLSSSRNLVLSGLRAKQQNAALAGPRSFQQLQPHHRPPRANRGIANGLVIPDNTFQSLRQKMMPFSANGGVGAQTVKHTAIEQLLQQTQESLSRSLSTGSLQQQIHQQQQQQPFQISPSYMQPDSQTRYNHVNTIQYQPQQQQQFANNSPLQPPTQEQRTVAQQQQQYLHSPLQSTQPQQQQQYSNQNTGIIYQNQYQPLQYQYVINNGGNSIQNTGNSNQNNNNNNNSNFQSVSGGTTNQNAFIMPQNQSQLYYSPQNISAQIGANAQRHILPRNAEFGAQGSQMPAMLDSQSQLQNQQNNQLLRNSYLNLGAFL